MCRLDSLGDGKGNEPRLWYAFTFRLLVSKVTFRNTGPCFCFSLSPLFSYPTSLPHPHGFASKTQGPAVMNARPGNASCKHQATPFCCNVHRLNHEVFLTSTYIHTDLLQGQKEVRLLNLVFNPHPSHPFLPPVFKIRCITIPTKRFHLSTS